MAEEVDYDEDEFNHQEESKPTGSSSSAGEKKQGDHKKPVSRSVTMKTKGRGHKNDDDVGDRYGGRGGVFERLDRGGSGRGPLPSIEGWIIMVTNVHQEAQEDDILDKFSECGTVKNIHVNLDRRTGFVKGYALVEFEEKDDALNAIQQLNGADMLGQKIVVDWAFIKK